MSDFKFLNDVRSLPQKTSFKHNFMLGLINIDI